MNELYFVYKKFSANMYYKQVKIKERKKDISCELIWAF